MNIQGIHPYADKFPMLSDAELAELAESIAANGLRNPIVVTPDGLILDGRNRFKACELAEIEASFEVYEGDDLAEYVIDCNSSRRHMTTGARAMSTALVLEADGLRIDGKWDGARGRSIIRQESLTNSRSWSTYLSQCGTVLDYAPALAQEVVDGHLALDAAYRKACEARDAERRKLAEQERIAAEEADAKAFVQQNAPDLAAEVGGLFQSFAEAQAVWEKRNREEAARIAREKAEKEKREKQERDARSDLYSGMARAIQALRSYGEYADIPKLMADYDPTELNPPQYEREFSAENLRSAQRFINELIAWTETEQ